MELHSMYPVRLIGMLVDAHFNELTSNLSQVEEHANNESELEGEMSGMTSMIEGNFTLKVSRDLHDSSNTWVWNGVKNEPVERTGDGCAKRYGTE
jgi:hypothetical protein